MAVDPASLAVTAALTAANMAVTAMQKFEGPRLKDTKGTVADYGTPLNYFLGTRLLTCPTFFAKPIREKKKKRKGKGGKQVDYTGFGTWASHIADHEIGGVLQVWFDNHLVYDNTGSEEEVYPLADDYDLEASIRVYLGTEAQTPDPDMLAYIEARDGADTCPAYRGTSYIYFENVPLEQLGNRYPDVKVLAYQDSALVVADTAEIIFVGQMQVDFNGAGSEEIEFDLTDGSDTTPQAGDFVLIVNGASRYPFDTGSDFLGGVDDYETLHSEYFSQTILADFKFQTFYKRMGVSPDTTFTVNGGDALNGSSDRNAFQVLVFRGVATDFLISDIESISGIGPADYNPADIQIGPGVFDPGDIGGTTGENHYIFKSFALRSTSGQALPIVVGSQCRGDGSNETAGNMLAIFQFSSAGGVGSRSVRVYGLYGSEYLVGEGTTLAAVLTAVSQRAGLESDEYNYSLATQPFTGYNWTQGTGQQICEGLADILDCDLRPHDFTLQALPRGSASDGAIATGEMVRREGPPYTTPRKSDGDIPRRAFLTYADTSIEQQPNVAQPNGPDPDAAGTQRELAVDMQTLAISPDYAQQLAERKLRRTRFGRNEAEFGLTRQRLEIEPGDVWTPSFDGDAMTMCARKVIVGANGKIETEWERDDPAVAVLSGSEGAPASGYIPDEMPDPVATEGLVMDLPYLVDAHDQSAPLAYLAAGPAEPGTWTGASFAQSDTGDLDSFTLDWDGIAADDGAIIGECSTVLDEPEYPWVFDGGSTVSVTINAGELTSATLDELLLDNTRNLAAIESVGGWELVQFTTATLTGELTYTLSGFLRGVRGTEWAMGGHDVYDRFVLLENAKRHTLGASEIGDTDYYIASTIGLEVDQDTAFPLAFTGASHKPYAPVFGTVELDGADWEFDATRRTRIGGNTLDGQDVPLGEASESWSLDIMDGVTVKRTITGTSLPLTYTEAQQITDWGGPLGAEPEANLYQVNPTLSLRGYPLYFPEGVS